MAMMAKGTAKAKIEQAKATITKAGEAKNQLKAKLEQRLQAAQELMNEARQAYNAALAEDDIKALKEAKAQAETAQAEIELSEAQVKRSGNVSAFTLDVYDGYFEQIKQALSASDAELAEAIEKAVAILAPAAEENKANMDTGRDAYHALIKHAPEERSAQHMISAHNPALRPIYWFVKEFLEKAKEYTF